MKKDEGEKKERQEEKKKKRGSEGKGEKEKQTAEPCELQGRVGSAVALPCVTN